MHQQRINFSKDPKYIYIHETILRIHSHEERVTKGIYKYTRVYINAQETIALSLSLSLRERERGWRNSRDKAGCARARSLARVYKLCSPRTCRVWPLSMRAGNNSRSHSRFRLVYKYIAGGARLIAARSRSPGTCRGLAATALLFAPVQRLEIQLRALIMLQHTSIERSGGS